MSFLCIFRALDTFLRKLACPGIPVFQTCQVEESLSQSAHGGVEEDVEGAAVSLPGDGGGWDRTRDGAGKEDCVQAPGDRELDVPLNCPPNINALRFPGSDTLIINLPPQGPSGGKTGRWEPRFLSTKAAWIYSSADKVSKGASPSFLPPPSIWDAGSHQAFTPTHNMCNTWENARVRARGAAASRGRASPVWLTALSP